MGGRTSVRPTSPPSPRQVAFNPTISSCRPPHSDELYVMTAFANHAAHCPQCRHPFRAHMQGRTLCDRGHAYARDVTQYIYSKAGHGFSVIDRDSVQIEIPATESMDSVRGLLKALDRGLYLRAKNEGHPAVVSQDKNYFVQERRERRHDADLVEIWPRSSRAERRQRENHEDIRRYMETERKPKSDSRGSLYKTDEAERLRRRREREDLNLNPVIIIAEPGRSRERSGRYTR